MTQPASTSAPGADFQAAAREFAAPGIVTQYTDKGKVRHQVPCLRLGQIALSDTMLFVLEGEKIQGWVYLAEIRSLHVEPRRTYKHPLVGAALALALIITPVAVIAKDPANAGRSFSNDFFVIWGPLMFALGCYTFFESILSRKVPWLIVSTLTRERAFMFSQRLHPTEENLIAALAATLEPAEATEK